MPCYAIKVRLEKHGFAVYEVMYRVCDRGLGGAVDLYLEYLEFGIGCMRNNKTIRCSAGDYTYIASINEITSKPGIYPEVDISVLASRITSMVDDIIHGGL